jgi:hypothetical protein
MRKGAFENRQETPNISEEVFVPSLPIFYCPQQTEWGTTSLSGRLRGKIFSLTIRLRSVVTSSENCVYIRTFMDLRILFFTYQSQHTSDEVQRAREVRKGSSDQKMADKCWCRDWMHRYRPGRHAAEGQCPHSSEWWETQVSGGLGSSLSFSCAIWGLQ